MTAYEQIKSLLKHLSAPEKDALREELANMPSGISIPEFSELIQRLYKKSVVFEVRTEIANNIPVITVVCITPDGEYSATGKNQKIAKRLAVQKAFEKINQTKNI